MHIIGDRKSTRLNSSHYSRSRLGFCVFLAFDFSGFFFFCFFFFAFSVDQEDQLLQSRLVLLLVLAEGTQGHSPTFDLCYLAEDMNLFHKVLHIIWCLSYSPIEFVVVNVSFESIFLYLISLQVKMMVTLGNPEF